MAVGGNFRNRLCVLKVYRAFQIRSCIFKPTLLQYLSEWWPLFWLRGEHSLKEFFELRFEIIAGEFGPKSIIHFLFQEQEVRVWNLGLLEGKRMFAPERKLKAYNSDCKYLWFIRIMFGFVNFWCNIVRGTYQIVWQLSWLNSRSEVN